MTTYRRMRRQARLARRSGLQPMMVINAGEPFPETVGVLLARWAWRYRSELAPLAVAACLAAAAWWLHRTRPHWWLFLAALTAVAGGRWACSARGGDSLRCSNACTRPSRSTRPGSGCPPRPRSARPSHRFGRPVSSARLSCRCPGGRTGVGARKSGWSASCKPGPISPRPSGSPVPRSCPPRWMYGGGGRGSGWRAARRSGTSSRRSP